MTPKLGYLPAALLSVSCAMDPIVERCRAGDLASCELACERAIKGEGGCESVADLSSIAAEGEPAEGALHYYEKACKIGVVQSCLRGAKLVRDATGQALLERRARLLERACRLSSSQSVAELAREQFGVRKPIELEACAELAASLHIRDADGRRQAYALACTHASERRLCMVKYEERLSATQAQADRCQPPPPGHAITGTITDERLTACSELATLLDSPRARALQTLVCAARDLDEKDCSGSEALLPESPRHGLRQPLLRAPNPSPQPLESWPKGRPPTKGSESTPTPAPQLLVDLLYDNGSPESMQLEGGLDWFRVHVVLKTALPGFESCYERAVAEALKLEGADAASKRREFEIQRRNPPLRGDIRLTFVIDAVGVVHRTSITDVGSGEIGQDHSKLGQCLQSNVRALRFEAATTARKTTVVQRIQLRAKPATSRSAR